ncbi:hypothetical protein, partial [Nocardia cyriacigeorgica]|uniref:hypothetical protein n=1 Tax=Nocardia cyriacigeorgica TaxID=135487 RepID=UPI001E3289D7
IGHATTIRSGTDNTGGEFGQLSLGNDLSSVRSATQPDLTGNTASSAACAADAHTMAGPSIAAVVQL